MATSGVVLQRLSALEGFMSKLSALEANSQRRANEIFELHRVVKGEEGRIGLMEKFTQMQAEMKQMGNKITRLETFEIPLLKQKNENLAEENRKLRTEMLANNKDVEMRTNQNSASIANMNEKMKNVEKVEDAITNLNGVRKVMNRVLIESHKVLDLDKKLKKVEKEIKRCNENFAGVQDLTNNLLDCVEDTQDRFTKINTSITCFAIKTSEKMVPRQRAKLNRLVNVFTNCGLLDKNACCLNVPAGVFGLNVWFQQHGEGEIRVFGVMNDIEDLASCFCFGRTTSDNDVTSSVLLIKSDDECKVTFAAMSKNGNASIYNCIVSLWRIY